MIKEGSKLTPVRLWILILSSILGVAIVRMVFNDLFGSAVSHVNALNSGHRISTLCGTIWVILLAQGITQSIRSMMGKPSSWPAPTLFLSLGLLSVLWIYLFMGELNIHELLFSRPQLWWLDPSAYYFNESLAKICAQMRNPPDNCTADWFLNSDIRNAYLVPEYLSVTHRLIALAPALIILMCAWYFARPRVVDAKKEAAA